MFENDPKSVFENDPPPPKQGQKGTTGGPSLLWQSSNAPLPFDSHWGGWKALGALVENPVGFFLGGDSLKNSNTHLVAPRPALGALHTGRQLPSFQHSPASDKIVRPPPLQALEHRGSCGGHPSPGCDGSSTGLSRRGQRQAQR